MDKKYYLVLVLSVVLTCFVDTTASTSDIITFVSIIMGFQVAAFSLLFSSNTVQQMYNKKSQTNPKITVKHELKNYYQCSFNTSLFSILVLLLIPNTYTWQTRTLIPIILINSYTFYSTNQFLYNIFIKENINTKLNL
jgi:hypothetical protein